jgi:hypothetical protein
MTIFELEPYKKIVVRSTMKYDSPEAFAQSLTIGIPRGTMGRVGNLFWANGIVFRHFPYAPTDSVSKQNLQGNLYLDHIEYTLLPTYRNEIKLGDISISLINVSNHTTFSGLTKWILQKIEKQKIK